MKKLSELISDTPYFDLSYSLYNNVMNENAGVFHGQIQLAHLIAKEILKKNEIILKDTVLAKTLKIKYDNTGTFYNCLDEKIVDNVFKYVEIYIDTSNNTFKDICISVSRELLHIYQNLQMIKSGKSLYDIYKKFNYKQLVSTSDNALQELCKDIIYLSINFEVNAFLSELSTEILNVSSFKEAKDCLKNSNTYKRYINNLSFLKDIHTNEFISNYFCNIVKQNVDIFKTESSNIKIIKYYTNKYERIISKIESNAAKILVKQIKENLINKGSILERSDESFKILEYLGTELYLLNNK